MHAIIKLILIYHLISAVITRPITVDSDYYNRNKNNYEVNERFTNSHYNRLPQNAQIDELAGDEDGEVDYEDQTDRPVSVQSANYQSSNNYYNGLLTENKIKIKKRRKKVRRPCIPIQSLGSPLFSNNRLKRQSDNNNNDREGGKTFGLFGGYPYYGGAAYPSYAGNYPNYASIGNYQRPQLDNSPIAQFGSPQYNHQGGYPCIPVSYGHVPHFGAGIGSFGGGGIGNFGSAGSSGGPLGFFGNGGLFDFAQTNPSLSYPQTVIINRPPLFANRPPYYSNRPSSSSSGSDAANDENGRPGFWGSVLDKLQEFVNIFCFTFTFPCYFNYISLYL